MNPLKNNSPKTWFVAERSAGSSSSYARTSRESAISLFTAWLESATRNGEPFTPHERGRRLMVTGPDWCTQPEDHDDPLLVGDAGLKAVLTAREYQLIVHGPIATALLES
jgi:hypothetical protein